MKHLCSIPMLALLLLFTMRGKAQDSGKKPLNVIFMMSDDHGYQAISAYGYGLNSTPNIDALAKKGVLFNRAFVTNSICGPSRAVMLTGKYSHINGYRDNISSVFDPTQQTVASVLKEHGYQTAMIGKWHLGKNPVGFDYYNILPAQGDYYNPDFIENGLRSRRAGYVTNLTMDYALDWLKKRDPNKPFFLICNQKSPHRNWMPETKYLYLFDDTKFPIPSNYFDDYKGRTKAAHEQLLNVYRNMNWAYDLKLTLKVDHPKGLEGSWNSIYGRMDSVQKAAWDKAYAPMIAAFNKSGLKGKQLAEYKLRRYLQDYLRCVQTVDDNVGRMNEYLKETGLDKNTVVIYTSDQGFYLGEHGFFDKRFMYEESFRTPLIISWPGVTNTAAQSNDLVMNLDFAETILDAANIKAPADMQGKSMLPILKKELKVPFRDAVYYHYYESGDEHNVAKHIGVRTDRYKLIYFYENNEWELYDLKTDPKEIHNLYPDKKYVSTIATLKTKLKDLQKQYNDPEPAI